MLLGLKWPLALMVREGEEEMIERLVEWKKRKKFSPIMTRHYRHQWDWTCSWNSSLLWMTKYVFRSGVARRLVRKTWQKRRNLSNTRCMVRAWCGNRGSRKENQKFPCPPSIIVQSSLPLFLICPDTLNILILWKSLKSVKEIKKIPSRVFKFWVLPRVFRELISKWYRFLSDLSERVFFSVS